MKTIKQTLLGFALSVFSVTAVAQCPTAVSLTVTSNQNNGNLNVTQLFNVTTNSTTAIYNYYSLYGSSNNYFANSFGANGIGSFNNLPTGSYSLCINDSVYCAGFSSTLNDCIAITITNTLTTAPCNASFTSYTDSNCVTHFSNTSTGINTHPVFMIAGNTYTYMPVNVSLANGNYTGTLYNYNNSGNTLCDSTTQSLTIACNGGGTITPTPCSASFTYYTDSLCSTYLLNTSTGSSINSYWLVDGNYYSGYNQTLQLTNGMHNVSLYNYSNGFFCDSTIQIINVACNSGTVNPSNCQANSSFLIFADTTNSGNYFAYNMSSGTGTTSYLWNFGDGSTSTQQYPFHQYVTPGHYIVCLTVTATNGTTTCTDSYCDSSSVQRVATGFLMRQINVIPQGITGVKENTLINGLKTYPNPLTDVLTIEVELTNNTTDLAFTIVDALGKVILKNNLKDSKTTINTSDLEKGFYFLSISTQDGKLIKTSKLVK